MEENRISGGQQTILVRGPFLYFSENRQRRIVRSFVRRIQWYKLFTYSSVIRLWYEFFNPELRTLILIYYS
jgi:hypothetical protein